MKAFCGAAMFAGTLFCYVAVLRAVGAQVAAPSAPALAERHETTEQRNARMAWWREARFGMFVHWGLYAVPAGVWDGKEVGNCGEWIMRWCSIPVDRYASLASQFDPVKYDAEKWVLAAKDAGVKYIVITAKHHEGFAMFQTAVDRYNIIDATPYKHDPIKDLVAACRKYGMHIGFYYSQNYDWHHPGGGTAGARWDKLQEGDADAYVNKIVIPQLRELLTNYGTIDILWFDIPGGVINKPRADAIWKMVTELQPNIIMNNRLGGGYAGDTETPERQIPPNGFPGRDWETCMTMNETWGFKKNDHDWKSSSTLIRQLAMCASMGGNFLLNVGPTSEGEIPGPSLERLADIGHWLKENGQAIYGTSASPFARGVKWGRITQKDNLLYLMVFDLPDDRKLLLPGLKTDIKKAWMLADTAKTPLTTEVSDRGAVVSVPEGQTLDSNATVIAVELAGKPVVDPSAFVVHAQPDGSLQLEAEDADIHGTTAKLEGDHVGYWTNGGDAVSWKCAVPKAGKYLVTVSYSCADNSAGSACELLGGAEKLAFDIQPTGGWDKFVTQDLGTIDFKEPGSVEIRIKALKKPALAVMNLRTIILSPR